MKTDTLNEYGNLRVVTVILAKNEEKTIREAVEGAAEFVHEVVVMMDGHSTDRTSAIAASAGATVYDDTGLGKGAAVCQSLALVDADIVVFMDADGSHDPADIPKLVLPIVQDETDLCVGSRFTGGSEELSVNFGQLIRTIGNISINIAINQRWETNLTDTLNGFRAVRRQALLEVGLRENKHTIKQEMVMKMLRYGYRVNNVPTHEYKRKFGESYINIWKEWPLFIWYVFVNFIDKTRSGNDLLEKLRLDQVFWFLGSLLVLLSLLLPYDWYNPLTKGDALPPPPIHGVTLLKISFFIEGLFLLGLAFNRWHFVRLRDSERLPIKTPTEESQAGDDFTAFWLLVAITGLALVLRLLNLNSELWLDEITPILAYSKASWLQVIVSYISSNNHLLNTLLVKLAVACFGEQEWAIRLPAAIFGIVTIPLFYWVARLALSRRASLGAALLLAVSYHHIFFSQNARGYTAYLFFSLLSAGLLVKGLQTDQVRIWAFYIVSMVLNFASLIISTYVLAAHILIGAFALFIVKHRGGSPLPLLKRLAGVFTVTGFLGFQLYATALPQMYVFMQATYTDTSAGYNPFSLEFLQELVRGISAGFGTGLILGVLPFLIIAGTGFFSLFKRNWVLTLALMMPGVILAFFLAARGLVFSPRFFLLALPLAILASVQGLYDLAIYISRLLQKEKQFSLRLGNALILAVCTLSLTALSYYYATPKQSYRSSLEYIEKIRQSNDIVIVIHLAEAGYHYYGQRFGIEEGKNYFFVRSVEALDEVLSAHAGKNSLIVTTFPRALRITYPDLNARIKQGWSVIRTFPATIGDGQISVWR